MAAMELDHKGPMWRYDVKPKLAEVSIEEEEKKEEEEGEEEEEMRRRRRRRKKRRHAESRQRKSHQI